MKNKKKVLLLAGIVLAAAVGVLGYQMHETGQKKLAEEAKRIEREEKEKAEAQKAAEAEEKRLEEIKAYLAAEEAQKAKEKAAEEAKKKEAAAKQAEQAKHPAAEMKEETEEITITPTEVPQAVAPLTMTGSKNEVTEKAKVIEPKQPETKVEPKPAVAAPTEDIKQHYEAEQKAEEAAKTDPAAPPVNQSGNGIANSDSPDNPFNHLPAPSGLPFDMSRSPKGAGYNDMATGDKF